METEARERWRAHLESWATPLHLGGGSDPVNQPDYAGLMTPPGGDPEGAPTPTEIAVAHLGGPNGSVIDVSVGAERIGPTLARRGHRVSAVAADPDEARALTSQGRMTVLVGTWPVIASNAGGHDVALSTHAAYGVPAIGPFIEALHRIARRGVVLEVTPKHPMTALGRAIRSLHGHEVPKRPTADDLEAVAREVTGAEIRTERWSAPAEPQFRDFADLLTHYRTLLRVTPDRSIEASGLLERDVHTTDDGFFVLGPTERHLTTLWWRT